MQKVRIVLLMSMLLIGLLAGCENIFAPPKQIPPPAAPAQEPAIAAPEPAPTPARVYLVSRVDCDSTRQAVRFTLYNPTEKALSLAPPTAPFSDTLTVNMNGKSLLNLPAYCGKESIASGESLDCVRSVQNDQDGLGYAQLGLSNAGSSQENTFSAKAPGYALSTTFECGGNRPNFAVTELSCSGGTLQFGVRNIFTTPIYLGTPQKGDGAVSQYEYLHLGLNEEPLEQLDESCGTGELAPGETANCMRSDEPLLWTGTNANGLPLSNTLSVRHKLYHAEATFPCS